MIIDATSVICITGASSGLGAACAVQYAQRGATVVLVARRADRLQHVAKDVEAAGGKAHVIVADVSREDECERAIGETISTFGGIDVLLANAGRGNMASVEDTPTSQWRDIFALNVDGVFWCTRAALPSMRKRGRGHIVAISSVAGRYGHPFNAAYVAAKHAVVGFIAALRTELIGSGINATCVCPAGILTEWADVTEGGAIGPLYGAAIPKSRRIAQELGIELAPLSRMMTADECAAIIINAVDQGRSDDVFTHADTKPIAIQAVEDRNAQEDRFEALWRAMSDAYHEQRG
jgi:NAD(P)-dependent dehydrogenase (short-subunit alcohol dehydrogenase family)